MAQHSVIIPCIADTYNDSATPNTNYGAASLLKMNNNSNGYTLLCFNFNDYNIKRKKIVLAKLYLFFTTIGTKTPLWFVQYPIRNKVTKETFTSADENVINFNNTEEQYSTAAREYAVLPASNSWVANNITALFNMYNVHNYEGDFWFRCYYDEAGYVVHSRENTNAPYIEVVYEDVPPNAPTPTEPIGQYKDSSAIIRFEWQYNSDVGGEQKAFDLQWSSNQVSWNTVSDTTSNTYYDMPADTLPAGNIYWRVRCYNEYDEESPWSDVQVFYSIGAPSAPAINAIPTDTARPTVTWVAFSQQVYQLQVLSNDMIIYDSGIVPGINIRQHKIKAWLADGEYTVRIRIKNEYDLWSEWGSAAVTISTDKPEKPSIALQRSAYGVEITGTGLVYRSDYDKDDYICIGTASGTYFDNTVRSKGEYKYFIRAVSENDTFEDSDIKFIQAELRHTLIAPVSDLSNVFAFTRSLNAPPKRVYNRQPGGAFVEYAGRKHPVWEPTEHIAAAWSMAFYLKNWTDVEDFVALVNRKETVLYRDAKGRKAYGVLGNLSVNDERGGYMVSFTLTEVDYNEELEV